MVLSLLFINKVILSRHDKVSAKHVDRQLSLITSVFRVLLSNK